MNHCTLVISSFGRIYNSKRIKIAFAAVQYGVVNLVSFLGAERRRAQVRLMNKIGVSGILDKNICAAVQKLMLIESLNIRIMSNICPSIFMSNVVDITIISKA